VYLIFAPQDIIFKVPLNNQTVGFLHQEFITKSCITYNNVRSADGKPNSVAMLKFSNITD